MSSVFRFFHSPFISPSVALSCFIAANAFADGLFSFLPFVPSEPNLDFNGDGMVRISILSPATHAGGVQASALASDLESLIKCVTSKPTRVSLVTLGEQRTIMGWWYSPDTRESRAKLFAAKEDLLLLAEDEAIVDGYPEFFFEGISCVSSQSRKLGVRTALVLMSSPGSSFRDKQVHQTANIVYRVGDGCGIEVIPAGYGWQQVLTHNRMPGDSPVKVRASAWLSAAAILVQLTGTPVPSAGLDAFWTTRRTTEALAVSAKEAVDLERIRKHYARPFSGVIRTADKSPLRLGLYQPTTADDPVQDNLAFILNAAHIPFFYKTPNDWYLDGLDRFTVPFDLAYGDQQQISQYLDRSLSTGLSPAPTLPKPLIAVYTRLPEGLADSSDILRRIEPLLLSGYDNAKQNGLAYIPYPLAWARACLADPALTKPTPAGKRNDWLSYMIASMIYTSATSRYLPTPDTPKPRHANSAHPAGFHATCARIGYDTVMQLASLSQSRNGILLRCETARTSPRTPCFASVRLLDRPSAAVRVYCGTDHPEFAALSTETLDFSPDNYDIEQTVRISATTDTTMLFTRFMASAHSSDTSIDGRADTRPLILNLDESASGTVNLSTNAVSPSVRPADILTVSALQHGTVTQTLCFTPDAWAPLPLTVHPTRADYVAGAVSVTLSASSPDLRFNGRQFTYTIPLSSKGKDLPDLKITAPDPSNPIDGPAFVTATAEAFAAAGIKRTSLYLGPKLLGSSDGSRCSAPIEKGPPQSRLHAGTYMIWAETLTADGLLLATPPETVTIR